MKRTGWSNQLRSIYIIGDHIKIKWDWYANYVTQSAWTYFQLSAIFEKVLSQLCRSSTDNMTQLLFGYLLHITADKKYNLVSWCELYCSVKFYIKNLFIVFYSNIIDISPLKSL